MLQIYHMQTQPQKLKNFTNKNSELKHVSHPPLQNIQNSRASLHSLSFSLNPLPLSLQSAAAYNCHSTRCP